MRDVFDHDTSTALGAFPYKRAVGDQGPFAVIGRLALDAGCGVSSLVGKAALLRVRLRRATRGTRRQDGASGAGRHQ
jgi:hypothetical protein